MAFILVQHLDPTHESMLVDLLSGHTAMTVRQATEGMRLEREHLYIIPPGTYLSVGGGALHLSPPTARHGARLPFDFLLRSLAEDCGARAVCVILSGTGADGSLGLKAVKEKSGLVIVQDPEEAAYSGMPRSAIMTGAVDFVLPTAQMPEALAKHRRRVALSGTESGAISPEAGPDRLPEIIDLLRTKTSHDFRLYKRGTLQRRIERRMAMAAMKVDQFDRYLDILRSDAGELEVLAKELLINVTGFFRDAKVFDLLAATIIPDLIRSHPAYRPLRIWTAGCSTGEEAYALAMVFREQIQASKQDIQLQVFASDVDPNAIASAREGLYPDTVASQISPERLNRFFLKQEDGYRVSSDLRSLLVFTVQDLLADPPFSRIDFVSCRNLLIYLEVEAQARVLATFHFALRKGGILLLGGSETIPNPDGRFEVMFRPERIYRRIGPSQHTELALLSNASDSQRPVIGIAQGRPPSRQAALAELCRRLVLAAFAPAAVLVNRKYECLFFLGPTDRYLRVAEGSPTHDLLAMARQGMRTKLRSAIQQASQQNEHVVVAGGRMDKNGEVISFSIDVQPVLSDGEELLLLCFIDEAKPEPRGQSNLQREAPNITELEQELEATKVELHGAIRNLELSSEEQRAINEEALSVSEEYQSTNEELLTSKEELQSLNEELSALNGQLQETLERQRRTSNDLQNILYSTDLATLFLDTNLNIRFFTPATKSLFNVIPGDVGRPLADISSLAADGELPGDTQKVLQALIPIEREIEARNGAWYLRRVLPYRTLDNKVEGVVITFADITERKHAADALDKAKRQAQSANAAKSRFLAAASHDLRQPLQTLALLQGLLAKAVEGERAQKLVARLDETLAATSGMLNTLLDINQIEAGVVRAEPADLPVNDLLAPLRDEFAYHAQAQGLRLRSVPCGLAIRSDPRLLEQMIRNLLSNALKYTRRGKVLIGCRRRGDSLRIEIWDTGIGIPDTELDAIFEEYHQVDNAARERSRGLGLGLSIVQSLAKMLGHQVRVRSRPGRGSVFTVEVKLSATEAPRWLERRRQDTNRITGGARRSGAILVVEDDPEVYGLLEVLLKDEGHQTAMAPDGPMAIDLVARGKVLPDLILADYNLPHGLNGIQVTAKVREALDRHIPVIIMTGDTSANTLRDIAMHDCLQLNKPVKARELTQAIEQILLAS